MVPDQEREGSRQHMQDEIPGLKKPDRNQKEKKLMQAREATAMEFTPTSISQTTGGYAHSYAGGSGRAWQTAAKENNIMNSADSFLHGGYTCLLMEQIRNSQEEDHTYDLQAQSGPYTTLVTGGLGSDDMDLRTLTTTIDWSLSDDQAQNSWLRGIVPDVRATPLEAINSMSTWNASGEVYKENSDQSSLTTVQSGGDDWNWRLDLFSNMQLEEENTQSTRNGATRGLNSIFSQVPMMNTSDRSNEDSIANSTVLGGMCEEELNGSQEVTEEEVEAFIQSEQNAATKGNNADVNSKYTPQIGMEFENKDDAHHYFNFYAFLAGFEVVITHVSRTTDRKINNEIFKVEMKCKCHGKPTKKEQQGNMKKGFRYGKGNDQDAIPEQDEEDVDICAVSDSDSDSRERDLRAPPPDPAPEALQSTEPEIVPGDGVDTTAPPALLPEENVVIPAQLPSRPASEVARSAEQAKVRRVQRAAPKAVCLPGAIFRAKVRRELMEMERAVLPDESVHPRDLRRLCIAEYGRPGIMRQLGLFLKADA
ncbi:hypothetical protein C2845_PM11G10510 [Panicum miliaceum]|uniref:FAR1 domain-containing protein n=1 Tax=Panicum miliaceum TaxID=4540 RepID=A0A3L6RSX1_PANMI|nr:hypothetical protein C2845_PM11G10510 [Panicum miliaceum]